MKTVATKKAVQQEKGTRWNPSNQLWRGKGYARVKRKETKTDCSQNIKGNAATGGTHYYGGKRMCEYRGKERGAWGTIA